MRCTTFNLHFHCYISYRSSLYSININNIRVHCCCRFHTGYDKVSDFNRFSSNFTSTFTNVDFFYDFYDRYIGSFISVGFFIDYLFLALFAIILKSRKIKTGRIVISILVSLTCFTI